MKPVLYVHVCTERYALQSLNGQSVVSGKLNAHTLGT